MMVSRTPTPTLQGLREASERWVRRERVRPRLTCGLAALDALLGGGWPQGKVGELVGSALSGRSGVAAATVAAATARGEVVAWLDLADAFDPASAAAAGVDLTRVLWVRPRGVEESVRAAELVLEVGGFTVVVLDLGAGAHGVLGAGVALAAARRSARERSDVATGGGKPRLYSGVAGAETGLGDARRRGRGALRLRLARAVERAGAVALVLADRPWVGTLAGVTVVFGWGEARWGECGESRWLVEIALRVRVERGAAGRAPAGQRSRPPGATAAG